MNEYSVDQLKLFQKRETLVMKNGKRMWFENRRDKEDERRSNGRFNILNGYENID